MVSIAAGRNVNANWVANTAVRSPEIAETQAKKFRKEAFCSALFCCRTMFEKWFLVGFIRAMLFLHCYGAKLTVLKGSISFHRLGSTEMRFPPRFTFTNPKEMRTR